MISFIIPTNNNWGDYVNPYIDSVIEHTKKDQRIRIEFIVVDTGSDVPYEPSSKYRLIKMPKEKHYNYMKALNLGASMARGDWLIFSNDDVLCEGEFYDDIKRLPRIGIYGNAIREKTLDTFGANVRYVYGWQIIMHKSVFATVGEFDEYYLHAGFDDIDYCWRASRRGMPIVKANLPFVHLADLQKKHRRVTVKGFREIMARSKEHFIKKVQNDDYS